MAPKRLRRIINARKVAESVAETREKEALKEAAKASRKADQMEASLRGVAGKRSSMTVSEMAMADEILAITAKGVAAARSSEMTASANAAAVVAIRQEHTRRRKALEKAQDKVDRAAREAAVARKIRQMEEIALHKASRDSTEEDR